MHEPQPNCISLLEFATVVWSMQDIIIGYVTNMEFYDRNKSILVMWGYTCKSKKSKEVLHLDAEMQTMFLNWPDFRGS